MIDLKKFMDDVLKVELNKMNTNDLEYEQTTEIITKGEKKLTNHLKDILTDYEEILKFAFELRK